MQGIAPQNPQRYSVKQLHGFHKSCWFPKDAELSLYIKKIKKEKVFLKQDDDRRPFVKDTVDPALSVIFVMLRDKVC